MIRNGLYSFSSRALDGVDGGTTGILVLRDGTIRGGDSHYYLVGSYLCADGRWKGELTSEEHHQAPATRPMARRNVSIGFSGSYTDEGAKIESAALVGKQCIRYEATMCLLLAD
jgi:hypothetical protein